LSAARPRCPGVMNDLVYLALLSAFFLATWGLVKAFERV
jgi:hypothetical protein